MAGDDGDLFFLCRGWLHFAAASTGRLRTSGRRGADERGVEHHAADGGGGNDAGQPVCRSAFAARRGAGLGPAGRFVAVGYLAGVGVSTGRWRRVHGPAGAGRFCFRFFSRAALRLHPKAGDQRAAGTNPGGSQPAGQSGRFFCQRALLGDGQRPGLCLASAGSDIPVGNPDSRHADLRDLAYPASHRVHGDAADRADVLPGEVARGGKYIRGRGADDLQPSFLRRCGGPPDRFAADDPFHRIRRVCEESFPAVYFPGGGGDPGDTQQADERHPAGVGRHQGR